MSRNEDQKLELRFLISTKAAGVVIGKGGENIKKIRQKFYVRINIPHSDGPERVLIMEGDLNSIIEIFYGNLEKMQINRDDMVDLRLLVHHSQVGCIIGRSGHKIKELREHSCLRTLKVYQMLCPCSTDRVIQLVGDLENVITSLRSIANLLESSPPKGCRQNYDARNYDQSISVEYGGCGPNHPAGISARNRNNAHNSSQFQETMCNTSFTGNSVRHSKQTVAQPVSNVLPDPSTISMLGGGAGGQLTTTNVCSESNGDMTVAVLAAAIMNSLPTCMTLNASLPPVFTTTAAPATTTTQVSISNKFIGAIMGRSGCRINQVRHESNADIQINKQEHGVEDRIITISGTPEQIQNAQFLLQMCVKRYADQV